MIACLDIGGSYMKLGRAGSPQEVTPLGRLVTPAQDFEAFAAAMAAMLDAAGFAPVDPVAISIAGVTDPASGIVTCANIPCIDGRTLGADLQSRLGRRVLIANDADCFALAEAGAGAGRGHRIVFGVILGTGVGGGLVVDGRLVVGAGGLTGEWGHGPVADRWPDTSAAALPRLPCGCGQTGCIDTIGGARGIERLHMALHGETLPSEAIVGAWRAGKAEAGRTIACQVDLISAVLALVVNVIGPSIVPVGGGLSGAADLIGLLDQAVRRRILRRTDAALVVPGACTVEPGLIGAGILGLQTFGGVDA